jgi:hypothetical protein
MAGLQYTNNKWVDVITEAKDEVRRLAEKSIRRDQDYVAYTVLVWAIYSLFKPSEKFGSFRMGLIGDPGVMFDRNYFAADYGNDHYLQGTPQTVQSELKFESFTQILYVQTTINMNSRYCNQLIQLSCFPDATIFALNRMGTYSQPADFDKTAGGNKTFTAKWQVDITSVMAAAAINLRIINTSVLIAADDREAKEYLKKYAIDEPNTTRNITAHFGETNLI